jgi:hypothetical protein
LDFPLCYVTPTTIRTALLLLNLAVLALGFQLHMPANERWE